MSKNILDKIASKKIAEDTISGNEYTTFQYHYKDNKTMLTSHDIAEIMEGLEKSFKKYKNVRFHILGIHKTGEKQLKGFSEEWDEDEWIDYFKNRVKTYKEFDEFFQIEITTEIPKQAKHKFHY